MAEKGALTSTDEVMGVDELPAEGAVPEKPNNTAKNVLYGVMAISLILLLFLFLSWLGVFGSGSSKPECTTNKDCTSNPICQNRKCQCVSGICTPVNSPTALRGTWQT